MFPAPPLIMMGFALVLFRTGQHHFQSVWGWQLRAEGKWNRTSSGERFDYLVYLFFYIVLLLSRSNRSATRNVMQFQKYESNVFVFLLLLLCTLFIYFYKLKEKV